MMMTRALFLLTLFASLALAKPNFSGEWKIDAGQSDFGDMPVPDSVVMIVEHSGPKLINRQTQTGGAQGDLEVELMYMTDGTESKNTVRGSAMTSNGKWSGDALKIDTKIVWEGTAVSIVEIWKLTSGGKILELTRNVSSEHGDSTMKLVFARTDKK